MVWNPARWDRLRGRTPTIIGSHSTPDIVPDNGVYTFVGSVEEAANRAFALAGGHDVDVFSAGIGTRLLRAGLVDEIRIHLVPVLLGAGTRQRHRLPSRSRALKTHSPASKAVGAPQGFLVDDESFAGQRCVRWRPG